VNSDEVLHKKFQMFSVYFRSDCTVLAQII